MSSDCSKLKVFLKNTDIYDSEIIETALTHPSYTSDNNLPYEKCYERLEFLGDAVLKLMASEYLYEKYPNYHEGKMSEIRAFIVSDEILAKVAKQIGLIDEIKVSHNDNSLKELESVTACAFEAVFGALYLEGKTKELKEFFEENFASLIEEIETKILNPKAVLQEYTQKESKQLPTYKLIKETGASHEKTFEIVVNYKSQEIGRGKGKSKKSAEQAAALEACERLGIIKEQTNKDERELLT